jgi:hypothetical protein
MIIPYIFATIGTILGIAYAILGMRAVRHLQHADQIDKAVGWSLWWCLESKRYDNEGRRLCKQGQLLALTAGVLWLAVYAIKWH